MGNNDILHIHPGSHLSHTKEYSKPKKLNRRPFRKRPWSWSASCCQVRLWESPASKYPWSSWVDRPSSSRHWRLPYRFRSCCSSSRRSFAFWWLARWAAQWRAAPLRWLRRVPACRLLWVSLRCLPRKALSCRQQLILLAPAQMPWFLQQAWTPLRISLCRLPSTRCCRWIGSTPQEHQSSSLRMRHWPSLEKSELAHLNVAHRHAV